MPISFLTLLLHWRDRLVLHQPVTLIPQEKIPLCLSRFTAQLLISLAWELVRNLYPNSSRVSKQPLTDYSKPCSNFRKKSSQSLRLILYYVISHTIGRTIFKEDDFLPLFIIT